MKSIVFSITAKILLPGFIILSLIIFYRGHNHPGGGFIGGLVAASGYVIYALAHGTAQSKKYLPMKERQILGTGLSIAFASGIPALFLNYEYMKALWIGNVIKLGTPMLFDFGVYLSVCGMVLWVLFLLIEEE